MVPKEGHLFAEKYRIVSELGRGGMGVVLHAVQVNLKRDVAIKVLTVDDRSAAERFQREARTVGRFENQHVVRVYDSGETSDGTAYIVMEFLRGHDLEGLLADSGSLDTEQVVDYILQACIAIAAAHAKKIVHRDLKPANIFLHRTSDGERLIKVLDFGIAKEPSEHPLTRPQQTIGTPHYMSPEQARGDPNQDARTDIWALGVIMYQLLTRELPFSGATNVATLLAVQTETPKDPSVANSSLSTELCAVITKCLEKDPKKRFRDIAALAEALAPFGGDEAKRRLTIIERVLDPTQPMDAVDPGWLDPKHAESEHANPGPAQPNYDTQFDQPVPSGFGEWRREADLVRRLRGSKDIVFLVGAGLHLKDTGQPGVAGAESLAEKLAAAYESRKPRDAQLAEARNRPLAERYRATLELFVNHLNDLRPANRVLQRAVVEACSEDYRAQAEAAIERDETKLFELESKLETWELSDAALCLGRLVANHGCVAPVVLTTNFDPLLEMALTKTGVATRRILLRPDGSTSEALDEGVIHLHGDWLRQDSASHPLVLCREKRPELQGLLGKVLSGRSLVVLGYAGHDPLLIEALCNLLKQGDCRELLWCFHEASTERVHEAHAPLLYRFTALRSERLRLYYDIGARSLLKELEATLSKEQAVTPSSKPPQAKPVEVQVISGELPASPRANELGHFVWFCAICGTLFIAGAAVLVVLLPAGGATNPIVLTTIATGAALWLFGVLRSKAELEHRGGSKLDAATPWWRIPTFKITGPAAFVAILVVFFMWFERDKRQGEQAPDSSAKSTAPIGTSVDAALPTEDDESPGDPHQATTGASLLGGEALDAATSAAPAQPPEALAPVKKDPKPPALPVASQIPVAELEPASVSLRVKSTVRCPVGATIAILGDDGGTQSKLTQGCAFSVPRKFASGKPYRWTLKSECYQGSGTIVGHQVHGRVGIVMGCDG